MRTEINVYCERCIKPEDTSYIQLVGAETSYRNAETGIQSRRYTCPNCDAMVLVTFKMLVN